MQTLILIVLAILSVAFANPSVLAEEQYQYLFSRFVSQYERQYDMSNFFTRFNTFKDNLNYVIAHNSKENETYKLAINHFGDYTEEEYFAQLSYQKPAGLENAPYYKADPNLTYPSEWDWRSKGKVTSVKNQGQCGGCWAFATAAAAESLHAIKKNELVDLSEQQLIDCTRSAPYNLGGCNGGNFPDSFRYMVDHGLCKASDYQFTGKNGECHMCNPVAHVSGYNRVAHTDDALLQAVSVNPVAVAVDAAPKGFMFYSSGVFGGPCGSTRDHGVTVVGYKADYWIVKNSWGSGWGQKGYIYLKRGQDQCAINDDPSFPYLN